MNNQHQVGRRVSSFERYNDIGPITAVALLMEDGSEIVAGDTTGYTLEIDCPYGTQAMADNILVGVNGKTYKGFRATGAEIAPDAELGDGIEVNGEYSVLAYRRVNFGPGHKSEIAAPGESYVEHEYGLAPQSIKRMNRKIAQTASVVEKNSEKISLTVKQLEDVEEAHSKLEQTVDSFTIEVVNGSSTAKIVLKSGDAVVGAGTIEMTGLVTFVGLAAGTTTIHGGCVSTGKIQDKTGNTYWDLDEGEMVLHNAEMRTLAVKTFLAADYTSDDLTAAQKIVNGTSTPTTAQIERYDINCDGQVDNADYARLYFIVNSQQNVTVTWKYCVDPADRTNTLSLVKEETTQYSDGTIMTGESVVFAAGAGRVKTNFLDAIGGMSVSGDVKAFGNVNASGNVHADGGFTAENGWTVMHRGNSGVGLLSLPDYLTSSNTTATVTYPAGTVGFHVYGYPVSGASMVGMFIPLDLCDGTSFQLADEGNYVTFTMTADTSAGTLTITRTGGAGWITSVHPLYFGSTT